MLSDNITAPGEVWIVGDQFVTDGVKHCQLGKEFNNQTRKGSMFMYDNFGVKLYTSPKDNPNNNYVARIRNTFAHGLNTRHKLPRILFILIDNGILSLTDVSVWLLNWLTREINRCILTKLDQLPQRCQPKFNIKVIS